MIRNILLAAMLCASVGCQFYQNVIVDEDGKLFPWHANRFSPEYRMKWNEEKAEWEIKDAERRYETGTIDRYQDNQIRKRHGLRPVL